MGLIALALVVACAVCLLLAVKVMELRTRNGYLQERVTGLAEDKASATRRLHEATLSLNTVREARRRDEELIRLQRSMIRIQKRWNRFHEKRAAEEPEYAGDRVLLT